MSRLFCVVLSALALVGAWAAIGCGSENAGAPCEGYTACGDYGTCDDSSGSIVCVCDVGYAGDECEGCATGYQDYGDGQCLSDDPCANDTLCASELRECTNSAGTAACGPCLTGFTEYGDGDCLPTDPCATDTVCAAELRECINNAGTAACGDCQSGYTDYGDGDCLPTDPCATDPVCASEHRECTNSAGVAACGDCLTGYYEDGGVCVQGCVATHHPGVMAAFDLLFLLDKSTSMVDDAKWTTMIAELDTFVSSADASGLGVGVQYFPVPPSVVIPTNCVIDADCGLYGPCVPISTGLCSGSFSNDSCDPVDYVGADVAITTLPQGVSAIQTSLAGHTPDGSSTPSQPSVEGALSYATTWAQSHPTHATRLVIITDGEPTNCTYNTIGGVAAAAHTAATGVPVVFTYVIAMGTALGTLDPVAQAGGTGQAYLVDLTTNPGQQLQDALASIRDRRYCSYELPAVVTTSGDYHLVDVALTDPASPPDATDLAPVADATACDPVTGGWHYDSLTNPTEIRLCDPSCDLLTGNSLDVDVLVGCAPSAP